TALVPAGVLDNAGRGRARWCFPRARTRPLNCVSRHLPRHDCGSDDRHRHCRCAHDPVARAHRADGDPMALTQDMRPSTRWAATPSSRELAFLSLVGAVIFFGGWQLIAMSGLVSQYILPSPLAVLEQIYQLETEPFAGFLLHQHLLSSLERFLLGFLLAAAL